MGENPHCWGSVLSNPHCWGPVLSNPHCWGPVLSNPHCWGSVLSNPHYWGSVLSNPHHWGSVLSNPHCWVLFSLILTVGVLFCLCSTKHKSLVRFRFIAATIHKELSPIHTADADTTKLSSLVASASAVCT